MFTLQVGLLSLTVARSAANVVSVYHNTKLCGPSSRVDPTPMSNTKKQKEQFQL